MSFSGRTRRRGELWGLDLWKQQWKWKTKLHICHLMWISFLLLLGPQRHFCCGISLAPSSYPVLIQLPQTTRYCPERRNTPWSCHHYVETFHWQISCDRQSMGNSLRLSSGGNRIFRQFYRDRAYEWLQHSKDILSFSRIPSNQNSY